ncbi:hypothetical protein NUW54_g13652 [Trametes sanguinea]|uniref:Uncharacterized protein n=1 Tax=Trametes sanguinea TaxID=158606 RepID=A0ACC1MIX4_9APHY|nr:hypothetical protein NUW54_g13652 [Trametes sanguinea]
MGPLTRTETLEVLASMGVEIPVNTKIPGDDLEKRLRAALDAAQEKARFSTPLDLKALPAWPSVLTNDISASSRPLLEAVKRGNMREAAHNYARGSRDTELFVDPFMDLRQTIMSLANVLDSGLAWCTIQDPEQQKSAINIRFLHVVELDRKTPAMVFLYRSITRPNAMEGARWVQHQVHHNPKKLDGLGLNISATQLEQKVLLKLFDMNAKLLPASFNPKKELYEEHYRATVLLPIGPLGPEAIGK